MWWGTGLANTIVSLPLACHTGVCSSAVTLVHICAEGRDWRILSPASHSHDKCCPAPLSCPPPLLRPLRLSTRLCLREWGVWALPSPFPGEFVFPPARGGGQPDLYRRAFVPFALRWWKDDALGLAPSRACRIPTNQPTNHIYTHIFGNTSLSQYLPLDFLCLQK